MTAHGRLRIGCGLVAVLTVQGCALTSRGEPLRVRYFALEESGAAHAPVTPSALTLRLGRIESSSDTDEALAIRTGSHELQYRDDLRWTEPPADFLRRELERALFQTRGLQRAYTGASPTLDVELTAFEEVLGPPRTALVRASAHVHDERRGLCERTFSVQRPIRVAGPAQIEPMVATLSSALQELVSRIADEAIACLDDHLHPPS